MAAIAAVLGVDRAGAGMREDRAVAFHAISAVGRRLNIIQADAPFGPAAVRELGGRAAHLAGMLEASPWKERALQERCDFLVLTLQTAQRTEERAVHVPAPGVAGGGGDAARLGVGTVPKHYQARVPNATSMVLSTARP